MNKVIIAGRLGQDPELKQGKSGVDVVSISVATNDYAGKEKGEETNWHRIIAFSHTAKAIASYTKKGSFVVVEGMLKTREYEKEGKKAYITEVIASSVDFSSSASQEKTTGSSANDDLPY